MQLFELITVSTVSAAVQAQASSPTAQQGAPIRFIAGGTNLVDYMKLNMETPRAVVDINRLPLTRVEQTPDGGMHLGALAKNTEVAELRAAAEMALHGARPQSETASKSSSQNAASRTRLHRPQPRHKEESPCSTTKSNSRVKRSPVTASKIIGVPTPRIDGPRKTSGTATYSSDSHFPGLVFEWPTTGKIANGTISAIDTATAEKMPGVLAVYTHHNMPALYRTPPGAGGFSMHQDEHRPPLEDNVVSYWGQYVAVAIAQTVEQARAAAEGSRSPMPRPRTIPGSSSSAHH